MRLHVTTTTTTTDLVLGAVEAVPAAALALHVLLGLASVARQTAHGLRWLRLMICKLHFCSVGGLVRQRKGHRQIEFKNA